MQPFTTEAWSFCSWFSKIGWGCMVRKDVKQLLRISASPSHSKCKSRLTYLWVSFHYDATWLNAWAGPRGELEVTFEEATHRINRTVTQDCKIRHINQCTAWTDDKEAYDSIYSSLLDAKSKPVAQVNIKCSIYQEDALSPLLFYMGMNPLCHTIKKRSFRFRFPVPKRSNHQLPPRHGRHQAVCQDWARHRLTDASRKDIQQGHRDVIRTR